MKSLFSATLLVLMLFNNATASELNDREKKIIENSVRKELIDPESARFKWILAAERNIDATKSMSSTYCGVVNSKNRYGGYTGDIPYAVFIIHANNILMVSKLIGTGTADWESPASKAILETCRDAGYERLFLAE